MSNNLQLDIETDFINLKHSYQPSNQSNLPKPQPTPNNKSLENIMDNIENTENEYEYDDIYKNQINNMVNKNNNNNNISISFSSNSLLKELENMPIEEKNKNYQCQTTTNQHKKIMRTIKKCEERKNDNVVSNNENEFRDFIDVMKSKLNRKSVNSVNINYQNNINTKFNKFNKFTRYNNKYKRNINNTGRNSNIRSLLSKTEDNNNLFLDSPRLKKKTDENNNLNNFNSLINLNNLDQLNDNKPANQGSSTTANRLSKNIHSKSPSHWLMPDTSVKKTYKFNSNLFSSSSPNNFTKSSNTKLSQNANQCNQNINNNLNININSQNNKYLNEMKIIKTNNINSIKKEPRNYKSVFEITNEKNAPNNLANKIKEITNLISIEHSSKMNVLDDVKSINDYLIDRNKNKDFFRDKYYFNNFHANNSSWSSMISNNVMPSITFTSYEFNKSLYKPPNRKINDLFKQIVK